MVVSLHAHSVCLCLPPCVMYVAVPSMLRVVEKKGIRSLLESRTKRQSRESFDELPSLDATTEAAIDEALTSSNPGEG